MSLTTITPTGRTGERTELARYTVPSGERIIYGQRVEGVVRLTDISVTPGHRAYLIERELEVDGYAALWALVEDYLREAKRLQAVPMACSPVETI